jgi:hypothetical protein
MGLGPEAAEGRAADQMGLGVEDVVDSGVGGKESLGGALALEFLLLSLSSPDRQMAVFNAACLLVTGAEASRCGRLETATSLQAQPSLARIVYVARSGLH